MGNACMNTISLNRFLIRKGGERERVIFLLMKQVEGKRSDGGRVPLPDVTSETRAGEKGGGAGGRWVTNIGLGWGGGRRGEFLLAPSSFSNLFPGEEKLRVSPHAEKEREEGMGSIFSLSGHRSFLFISFCLHYIR